MLYYATPSEQAQDSFMVCQCLLNSLTLDFLKTITADASAYHLPALPAIVAINSDVLSGPLLLTSIISRAQVNSLATVSFIRTSLTKLDKKIIKLDSNVMEYNIYIKAQVKSLITKPPISMFTGY